MPDKPLRIALVGAGTLAGKALNDELADSEFAGADIRLMDEDEALGNLTVAGDEVTFIQEIESDSFETCDFTFFAGSRELTRKHWRRALDAGSRIVDLSGEMEGVPGIPVCAPWIHESLPESASTGRTTTGGDKGDRTAVLDLQSRAVVSAHPAAVLLALLAARGEQAAPLRTIWVTLMQPASEYGQPALEELHRQTTSLLSFQPLPTEVFGNQAAFTLAISFGGESRASLEAARATICRHFAEIAPALSPSAALQIVQVPIFHGYGLSVALEFKQPVKAQTLQDALAGSHVQIVQDVNEFPGNASAVGEEDMHVLVRPASAVGTVPGATAAAGKETGDRFWIWAVADNLKFAAKNAIACATELNRLRPRGSVQ